MQISVMIEMHDLNTIVYEAYFQGSDESFFGNILLI
jgi:hypothetical protein